MKNAIIIIGVILLIISVAIYIRIKSVPDYRSIKTKAGFMVNKDLYLTLSNGEKVWIDIWLPENLKPGEKIGTVIETSRYGDMWETGWLAKILGIEQFDYSYSKRYREWGYAFAWIQSPGTAQSTGSRLNEYPTEDLEAMNLAIEWISKQPWSNKRIGSHGSSYSGTTSDMSTAAGRDELKVAIPFASDFNSYSQLTSSGGIHNAPLMDSWIDYSYNLDNNRQKEAFIAVGLKDVEGIPMGLVPAFIKGLKVPTEKKVFKGAIEEHKNNFTKETLPDLFYAIDGSLGNHSLNNIIKLYSLKSEIEDAQIPTYSFCGWFDAGVAEGVLQKFATINSPQEVVILPSDHFLKTFIDPFSKDDPDKRADLNTIYDIDIKRIFDRHLKKESEAPRRSVTYFTFGINEFQNSDIWPPKDLSNSVFYLGERGSLTKKSPDSKTGNDSYLVDFSATNGKNNRWMNQTMIDVDFIDRKKEGDKLLTYRTEPLSESLEVTGTVTVTLYLSSSQTDGAFYVYLEDISPEGEVVYLTEGALRGVHRKTKPSDTAPFSSIGGVYQSFKEEDMEFLNPGEITELSINLLPISTVFKKGHSIRISIAGHDESRDIRIPSDGDVNLNIQRNKSYASKVILPSKVWKK